LLAKAAKPTLLTVNTDSHLQNGASWTKGASSQYDLLPVLTGDSSWGWEPFNTFLKKAEHFNPPNERAIEVGARYDPAAHGTDGNVQVSFAAGIYKHPQLEALEASYKVWGNLTRDDDAADGTPDGATIIPNMLDSDSNQNRSSSFTAYTWHQIQQRSNWVILTGHRATEIMWSADSGSELTAEGVRFQACRDCPEYTVSVKREVLLAAGSLQSPQLLELSGVGDPSVLSAAGVPLKMALPGVGKHMQEQTKNSLYYNALNGTNYNGSGPSTAVTFTTTQQVLGDNTSATYDYVIESLPAYAAQLQANGYVADANGTLSILQAQVNNLFKADPMPPAAEVFFTVTPSSNEIGIDLWNLIVMARGTVHIASNCSWDHPVVDPNYFAHPLDLMIQSQTSKQSREVYQTSPLSDFVGSEKTPGSAVAQGAVDAAWEGWVKSSFTSVWHYIASLACMKKELGGVVDSQLKVYGISNVRAIDASVLPVQLSAHLSSSLYGIAEKAAVMIKEAQE
jgi:choline dehydrogenase